MGWRWSHFNFGMDRTEFIKTLEKFNLPKSEFIILSGGSLLMRGLREKTADFDLCVSKKLAEEIDLYDAPKDEKGFFVPFPNCQMMDNFENIEFDVVDGHQCESLESILAFKKSANRPKDQKDIEKIEAILGNLE
jgi:hypothetical protein